MFSFCIRTFTRRRRTTTTTMRETLCERDDATRVFSRKKNNFFVSKTKREEQNALLFFLFSLSLFIHVPKNHSGNLLSETTNNSGFLPFDIFHRPKNVLNLTTIYTIPTVKTGTMVKMQKSPTRYSIYKRDDDEY